MAAKEVKHFKMREADNDAQVHPILKLTGADGRQACLADWENGLPFLEWDSPWRLSNKDMWELKSSGYTGIELWETAPLVRRVVRIPL